MLESAEERIWMLKKGYTQKQIEELYIEVNGFRISEKGINKNKVQPEARNNKTLCIDRKAPIEYAQLLCFVDCRCL